MKVLYISSEAAPLVKVGGLADVSGALPKALNTLGQDVRVMIPQYSTIDRTRYPVKNLISDFPVHLPDNKLQKVNLNYSTIDGVPFYLVENSRFFGSNEIYVNELERFYFYCRAVFELLPQLDWQPDIIHCQDWVTALVIPWVKLAGYPYRTVFTIHNLNYQGRFDQSYTYCNHLAKDWQEAGFQSLGSADCFMGPALQLADRATTVSPTYAREIATPEFGVGLDSLVRSRQEGVQGILNGIDTQVWNPQSDSNLAQNYTAADFSLRRLNKITLQKTLRLTEDNSIPLLGMVQRLDEQKGLDILLEGLDNLLQSSNLQLVIIGKGRDYYERGLQEVSQRFAGRVAFINDFAENMAHLVYAGCDLFVMPSRFEPCGLGQMIAMRYGAIPLVRHTGGLVDSVVQFDSNLSKGNGFVFHEYSSTALNGEIKKALVYYYNNRKLWTSTAQRISQLDFSWDKSAREYLSLYEELKDTNE